MNGCGLFGFSILTACVGDQTPHALFNRYLFIKWKLNSKGYIEVADRENCAMDLHRTLLFIMSKRRRWRIGKDTFWICFYLKMHYPFINTVLMLII